MDKKWEISGERILVAGDCHQNTLWLKSVFEREAGKYDHFVFLGDAFDSFMSPPEVSSIEDTAIFFRDIIENKYGPATVLFGNHDLPYYEAWHRLKKSYAIKFLRTACSGYTDSKAQKIAKIFEKKHWEAMQLFVVANGYLCSHAGFRSNNWYPFKETDAALSSIYHESRKALELIEHQFHPYFTIGRARGGSNAFGGPVWLDFEFEFEDELPLPQIVGHTPDRYIRNVGKSYCIDTSQRAYAVISLHGGLRFEMMEYDHIEKKFVAKESPTPIPFRSYHEFHQTRPI